MLGMIANYCSVVSRNSIIKSSTSLNDIWQKIRQHYGFQSTGAHFLDLASIKLQPGEKPQDLYQRLMAFFEDNLLTSMGGITHHGEDIQVDEDMSPTLENTVVVLWLQLIHPGLPQLVKQKYGVELRNKTLASLKPEISQALTSLLDELRSIEDTKVLRAGSFYGNDKRFQSRPTNNTKSRDQVKSCTLCKAAGRTHNTHFLSGCRYLPDMDRRAIARSRLVQDDESVFDNPDLEGPPSDDTPNALLDHPSVLRVNVVQSPFMNAFYKQHPVRLTIDTGATTNMICASLAKAVGLHIVPASQMAHQADGVTPLEVTGEVHCELTRDDKVFHLDALVVNQLDVDVLAGNPFLVCNDIAARPAKRQIIIGGSEIIQYGGYGTQRASARRTQSFLLRGPPQRSVILPGEFIQLRTPMDSDPDSVWALEPRVDSPSNHNVKPERAWPPVQEVVSVGNTIRLTNDTDIPILIRKSEHLCQVRSVSSVNDVPTPDAESVVTETPRPTSVCYKPYSDAVTVDPDGCLTAEERQKFVDINHEYDDVFIPDIPKYNGASGKIEGHVNMGPTLPPQRKGKLPDYNKDSLVEMQQEFDKLEAAGVFATPEQVNVVVEYLNLTFMVAKPNGGKRIVTSFGEVGRYSKPQPALMANVDNVLREIGKWKYIIVTDLLKSFYQIPLAHDSMKYCGVVTPFKGVRVYTRCAMGMPGSETVLEELMSRVLGELIMEGCALKIADDLYCGGDSVDDALSAWIRILKAMKLNNLGLNAPKTMICPKSSLVLGWIWSHGTIKASPHKIAALASVDPPTTVQGLRSFIGAYKVLSRVLSGYASLLDPLDQVAAGRQSREKIMWSDSLLAVFRKAQECLSDNKVITLPHREDCLWIVTDGSVKKGGVAATMYALRDNKLHLCGFFSAKLKKHQITWLPCEIEALAISASVRHFAPYIIQSNNKSQVLTDSRPCVQAYQKLLRGEFSASARVTTFLAVVSRYHLQVRHIAGIANLPSDFASRNPSECSDQSCQVCKFIAETQESVVRGLSVKDVMEGSVKMPFMSRAAWLATQQECPDLRRTYSHLTQGTHPSKKMTKVTDVKRYLKLVVVANDGLLIVRDDVPFQPPRERLVVPRSVLDGLLTAIHIRFCHPTRHQTKQVFTRYFFALDLDKALNMVTSTCHHCNSVKSIPTHLYPQSTSPPPSAIGLQFAADIMKRYRQLVLVLRETVTSYTLTTFIDSERHECLRDAIITLCAEMRSLGDGGVHIRVDPAPGLVALKNDTMFKQYGITLEIGRAKNVNKNPVAEGAIMELGLECLHLSPDGGPLSKVSLALATANLNSRIRQGGLSAREIWTQRDQVTGQQLAVEDRQLILKQHLSRTYSHASSAKAQAHGKSMPDSPSLSVGDLIYLKGDRDKTKARDKYMITSISDDMCQVRKFSKSQFRAKPYDVRIIDCYPVLPTTLAGPLTGPIRGLDDSTALDNVDPTHIPVLARDQCHTVEPPTASLPPVPNDIVNPPMRDNQPTHHCAQPEDLITTHPMTYDPPESMPTESSSDSIPDMSPLKDVQDKSNDTGGLRRSTQTRKKPIWQQDDVWIME